MEKRSESGPVDGIRLSVKEAVQYIDKCEKAANEIIWDFNREERAFYRVCAIDARTLTGKEAYNQQVIRNDMDVPYRAQLLMQITEELAQIKVLVSEACRKNGIKYDQKEFIKMTENRYVCLLFDPLQMEDGVTCLCQRDTEKKETFLQTATHMSPKDEMVEYRYSVIMTKKLRIDQSPAGRLAEDIRRHSKEYEHMVKAQMSHIYIEYMPAFDIHADWHSWMIKA